MMSDENDIEYVFYEFKVDTDLFTTRKKMIF